MESTGIMHGHAWPVVAFLELKPHTFFMNAHAASSRRVRTKRKAPCIAAWGLCHRFWMNQDYWATTRTISKHLLE